MMQSNNPGTVFHVRAAVTRSFAARATAFC